MFMRSCIHLCPDNFDLLGQLLDRAARYHFRSSCLLSTLPQGCVENAPELAPIKLRVDNGFF
jgi:hypothetical protein